MMKPAYYHQGRPAYFRFHFNFLWDNKPIDFFWDLDAKNRVEGLWFEYDGEESVCRELSFFVKQLEGKDIKNCWKEIDLSQNFPFYLVALEKMLAELQGLPDSVCKTKGTSPLNLICRCFGVYREDIHALVGRGESVTSLNDLATHLKAGIGCGSCHEDLWDCLNPLIPAKVETSNTEVSIKRRWETLDPQSLAQEIHQVIVEIRKGDKELLKLEGTKPGSVLLRFKGHELGEMKVKLQSEVDLKLGSGLELVFL